MLMKKYKPTFLFLALLGTCSAAYFDYAPSNGQHQFTHGDSSGADGFGGRPGSNGAFGGKPGGAGEFSGRPTSSGGPGFGGGSAGHTGPAEFVGSASGVSNDFHSIPSDPIEALAQAILGGGIPGSDYPILAFVPDTGFTCDSLPGYYADTGSESQCQVFHICQEDGRKDSFLCPNGTLFQQQYFVCDWWFNVDCSSSSQFYELNAEIGKTDAVTGGGFGSFGAASGLSGFGQAAGLGAPAGSFGGFGAPASGGGFGQDAGSRLGGSGFGGLGAASSAVGATSVGSGAAAPSTIYDFPSVGNGQNGGGSRNGNRGSAGGAGSRNGNRGAGSDAGSRNGNRGGVSGSTVGNRIGSQAGSEQNGRVVTAPSSLYGAPNPF